MMKIVTWNVNSIKMRESQVKDWLVQHQPDVLCLQELKAPTEAFPYQAMQALGYHAAVFGQKTYNGVAILSRAEPSDIQMSWTNIYDDPQARLIAATIAGVRIICVYVPNGSTVDSDKYIYKLQWLSRLRQYIQAQCEQFAQLVVCGDFNVAPGDADVANPPAWQDSVLCCQEVREHLAAVVQPTLVDVLHEQHPQGGLYSWWDYRHLSFVKNQGLRIDLLYATQALAKSCVAAGVDREARKHKPPSDHAPVWAEFAVVSPN